MSPARNRAAADGVDQIAALRIELCRTDPPIWRRVEVPISITLAGLHEVVQAAMGWHDEHLWEFTIGKRRYGLSMDEDWGTEPRPDAREVRLRDVLKPRRTVIGYVYDFGDCWEHRLTVTGTRAGEPGLCYPRYIAGERNAPPEDCGGIPGFYEFLGAVADASHENHAESAQWLDGYDPDAIDEPAIKSALARIADRRSGARARRAKKPAASR
jgi:hypothetical protein